MKNKNKIIEYSVISDNEEEHFESRTDALLFLNNISNEEEKESSQFFSKEWNIIDGEYQEGDVIDATLVNETLGVGETVSLKTEIQGQFDRGHPHGGIVVYEYANGYIDEVILTINGVSEKVAVPSFYSNLNGSQRSVAYKVPALLSDTILSGTLFIDTDDTNNPDGVPSTAINTTFYGYNYYQDEKAGSVFKLGVEDENGAQVFQFSQEEHITLD